MRTALLLLLLASQLQAQPPAANTNAAAANPASANTATKPVAASPSQLLFKAAERGDLSQVTALLNQGANINARFGREGYTPLIIAASAKQWDVVRYLMTKGADLNLGATTGTHALIFPLENGESDLALAMVNAGANPNLCDRHYLLPIVYVARAGNIDLMKAFIAHGADVNLNGSNGPALHHAIGHDHPDMVRLLLDSGARLDIPSSTDPLQEEDSSFPAAPPLVGLAATKNDLALIDLLLARGAPMNTPGQNGETPLTEALEFSNVPTIVHLLEKGADPNLPNVRDLTPLMVSMRYGDEEYDPAATKALLDHGARIDQANKSGDTALMEAAEHLHLDPVQFLVDQGANINLADNAGATALLYAGERGNTEIPAYLANKGATRADIHITSRPADRPPLTPAQAFGVAVAAVYTQVNGHNPHVLGVSDSRPFQVRRNIARWWSAKDKASYLKALGDLRTRGWGATYRDRGKEIAQFNDRSLIVLAGTGVSREVTIKRIHDLYQRWGERSGVAWDLCRYVNLVEWGYTAGYLSRDEAWADILPAARDAQKAFSSWKEMADNFLDGREIWNHGSDESFDNCIKLLLDPKEKESVWNQIPWNTDLGK